MILFPPVNNEKSSKASFEIMFSFIIPCFPQNKTYPQNKPQLSETLPSTIMQQAEDDMTVFESM